jgi:hypothetical protein
MTKSLLDFEEKACHLYASTLYLVIVTSLFQICETAIHQLVLALKLLSSPCSLLAAFL